MLPSFIISILHGFVLSFRDFLEIVIATIDATGKPGMMLSRGQSITVTPYADLADEPEVTHLPASLSRSLGNELWDLHLAFVYFVPVFVAALLGGMIAACLIPRGLTPARTLNREESSA